MSDPSHSRPTARPDSLTELPPVPRNVVLMGITSLFADVSTQMVYPLMPIFLTSVIGAPVAAVGVIEGIAESTASFLAIGAGWWSDRVQRRLPLAIAGYSLSTVGKLVLALAGSWPLVLVARFVDRFGKGIRGAPRDALIADSTPEAIRGRAFGFHRMLDTTGAVLGPLLALGLAALLHDRLRVVFALAVVPGLLSIVPLLLVKEPPRQRAAPTVPSPRHLPLTWRGLDGRLRLFLLASLLFALGNSSDAFLILRAKDLGLSTTAAVLAYVVYNIVYMVVSLPAGIVSDRIGRRAVYVTGLLVFAAVYAGFALADRASAVWPLFAAYGLYIALTDGIGKALVTDFAPRDRRATVLGTYALLTGVGALIASIVAGQLWDRVGVAAPFFLGSGAALAGAVIMWFGLAGDRSAST